MVELFFSLSLVLLLSDRAILLPNKVNGYYRRSTGLGDRADTLITMQL